jgi:hypothetical protein
VKKVRYDLDRLEAKVKEELESMILTGDVLEMNEFKRRLIRAFAGEIAEQESRIKGYHVDIEDVMINTRYRNIETIRSTSFDSNRCIWKDADTVKFVWDEAEIADHIYVLRDSSSLSNHIMPDDIKVEVVFRYTAEILPIEDRLYIRIKEIIGILACCDDDRGITFARKYKN